VKKTWRWGSVMGRAADVMRTAPSLSAAAAVLQVDRQTVHRWVKAGKIPPPGGGRQPLPRVLEVPASAAWGDRIRALYALSVTDLELVPLAETALALARDESLKASERLAAMARFQSLVRQLHLEETDGEAEGQSTPWPAAG